MRALAYMVFGFAVSTWVLLWAIGVYLTFDSHHLYALSPDPNSGRVYVCSPKGAPWYYDDVTIVRSWNWVIYAAAAMIADLWLRTMVPVGRFWQVKPLDGVAIGLGLVLALVFKFAGGELWLIHRIMDLGVSPEWLPCSPIFLGY